MESIAYILLACLILSVLLLVWCAYELVRMDKQNQENIIVPTEKEITFPSSISRFEMNQVLRQIAKNEKIIAKMKKSYRRIIY